MNKKLVLGIALAVLAIVIAGVTVYMIFARTGTPIVIDVTTNITADDLNYKLFRIISLDGVSIPTEQEYFVTFFDGSVSARICNTISGGFNIADNIITGALAQTLKYCDSPPGIMNIESAFATLFNDGASINLADNILTLSSGGRSLVFTQM